MPLLFFVMGGMFTFNSRICYYIAAGAGVTHRQVFVMITVKTLHIYKKSSAYNQPPYNQ